MAHPSACMAHIKLMLVAAGLSRAAATLLGLALADCDFFLVES